MDFPLSDTAKFPVEVHIFETRGVYHAFDVHNFTILKLDRSGAEVLYRMRDYSLNRIIEDLAAEFSAQVVKAYYVKFLELIKDGALSLTPSTQLTPPPFNRLVLMLAGGCNMGCRYCFEKDVPTYQKPNLMTRETADEVLNWFFKRLEGRKARIQLYGGEPLLNWQVLQHVVECLELWAQENDIELTMYLITNGTLLSTDSISYLVAHKVSVQVSVDGDAATHDRFRVFKSGLPTMDRISPHIKELIAQGADFNLRAVMTRQNRDPQVIIDGLRSHGAERVSFEVVSTDYVDALFTDEDWKDFNDKYRLFVSAPYKTWKELHNEMQSMIVRICERRKIIYGCGAGINEVTVAPDGSVYECERLDCGPFMSVFNNESTARIASRFLTAVDKRQPCKDCWARYLCGGGCKHQSILGHGKEAPLPQFCVMIHNLLEASILKIDEIRNSSKHANSMLNDYERGMQCTDGL